MEVGPGVPGDAVRRPGVRVVRIVREVAAGIDVVVLGRDHVVVAVVAEASSELMPRATAAPPATASEPPSQKSFCTSTMMSARTEATYLTRAA